MFSRVTASGHEIGAGEKTARRHLGLRVEIYQLNPSVVALTCWQAGLELLLSPSPPFTQHNQELLKLQNICG